MPVKRTICVIKWEDGLRFCKEKTIKININNILYEIEAYRSISDGIPFVGASSCRWQSKYSIYVQPYSIAVPIEFAIVLLAISVVVVAVERLTVMMLMLRCWTLMPGH